MADSLYVVLDERFSKTFNGTAKLELLHEGSRWAEAQPISPPAAIWFWSDIPNDRIMRWDEATGTSGIFRYPAGHTNGHTVDRQGRLVSCEHGGRRVSRTEHDGSITTIADRFEGKRLNSPNDVVVKSDNSIWFTDPAYGIDTDYEGHKAESEIGGTTFTGWTRKPARSRSLPAISFDPTALHFLLTKANSSSPILAHLTSQTVRAIRIFDVADNGTLFRRGCLRRLHKRLFRWVPFRYRRLGQAPAMASIATTPTGR